MFLYHSSPSPSFCQRAMERSILGVIYMYKISRTKIADIIKAYAETGLGRTCLPHALRVLGEIFYQLDSNSKL